MITIQIENKRYPLPFSEELVLVKSVARLGDLRTRSGLVSSEFSLPLSQENAEAIGIVAHGRQVGDAPYRRLSGAIIAYGHVIARGFFRLSEVDYLAKKIKLNFFGDNANWFDAIPDESIRSLDLRDLNHNWTVAAIVDSFANDAGYTYPIIDPGRWDQTVTAATEIEDWWPAVFYHTLLERIFRQAGFRLEGPFLDSFEHLAAIVPLVSMVDGPSANEATFGRNPGFQLWAGVAAGFSGSVEVNLELTETNSGPSFSVADDAFVSDTTGDVTLTFSATIEVVNWANPAPGTVPLGMVVEMVTFIDGVEQTAYPLFETTTTNSQPLLPLQEISVTETFALVPLAQVSAKLRYRWSSFTTMQAIPSVRVTGYQIASDLIETDSDLIPGQEIDVAYNLPDISQRDFIRDWLIRNGLLTSHDPYTQVIVLETFENLVRQKDRATNWTGLLDTASEMAVSYAETLESYGRRLWFRYAEDADDAELVRYEADTGERFGDGRLHIENEFLPEDAEFYQSPFAPTYTRRSFANMTGNKWIPFIPRYDADGERLKTSPRLLYGIGLHSLLSIGLGVSVKIGGTSHFFTGMAYFAKPYISPVMNRYWPGLNYGMVKYASPHSLPILPRAYGAFERILNAPEVWEVSLVMRPDYFRDMNMLRPVFIQSKSLTGYFFIDEIVYDGRRGRAKLIRINNG